MNKNITQPLKIITLALVLSVGISYVSAWTAPTVMPPGGNTKAPINVGSTAQTKTGPFNVETSPISSDTELGHFSAPGSSAGVGYTSFGGGFVGWDYANNGIALNAHGSGGSIGGIFVKSAGPGNSNVGIGTVNPQGRLDVSGDIRAGNSDIYFTKTDHNHTGIGNTLGYAAIENTDNYDTLMVLGRPTYRFGPWTRSVSVWDRLDVYGSLYVNGVQVTGAAASGSLVLRTGSSCSGGEVAVQGYANPSWVACTGGGSACVSGNYNCNSMTYGGWGSCSSHPNKCGNGSNLNLAGNVSYSTCSDVPTCWDDGTFDTGNWYNCASLATTKVICQIL